MITVATLLWGPNDKSKSFSTSYSEEWVERLFRGFARNLTVQWKFVLFTDHERKLGWPIEQIVEPGLGADGYADCIKPYRLGVPMLLCGLDTIVTGNIDHLAEYCMTADTIALPRDPYQPSRSCNGVALVPKGMEYIAANHRGENDMDWLRAHPHVFSDDLWPGHIVSYKGSVESKGLGDARVVFMHGEKKAHQLGHVPFVKEHWV